MAPVSGLTGVRGGGRVCLERAVSALGPDRRVRWEEGPHRRRALTVQGRAGAKAQGHEGSEHLVVPSAQRDGHVKQRGDSDVQSAGPHLVGP